MLGPNPMLEDTPVLILPLDPSDSLALVPFPVEYEELWLVLSLVPWLSPCVVP